MSQSEIARLREEIEQGYQAMKLGLSGYAITARHSIITHKYDALGEKIEQLGKLIGEEEANRVAGALYLATMG